ncbi:hypothetical protein [Streptomyces sp. NBC_01264]|uniref:hypothetical protein n=1 Tax=Streptomyces sp. NBC_01264 TaxID=2903804 RepID=UPI002252ED60|nr:hypothetical protein [Streptomyces sp. NBC_01264]MCX4775463.1 hypothetical protein [Streptomyces sp. NBC_01264]
MGFAGDLDRAGVGKALCRRRVDQVLLLPLLAHPALPPVAMTEPADLQLYAAAMFG